MIEATPVQMETSAYWREQGIDIAIVFNWLRGPELLEALRTREGENHYAGRQRRPGQRAGVPDGDAETEHFVGRNMVEVFRQNKHWLRRYLLLGKEEDAELIATVAASDAVAIESQAAADNLREILHHYHRPDLATRVKVVPP